MKKKNFKVKKFDGSEKTHEVKRDDLITQYKRMSSIAYDIYNSDFFAMATKKEQKEIEASVACITRTLVSMIGLDAIDRSYFPDDSGNDTGTDKNSHDAIKKMMNSVYGATGNMQKAVQKYTDTDHAPHPIMAMNRKILSELGIKSPADKSDDVPSFSPLLRSIALGNDYDDDSDEDEYDVDFGNFADGPFYSDQYKHICQIYGFNTDETLKRIVNAACDYIVSKINLVAVVNDKHDIKSDDEYYPKIGDVFFVTNKENDKDPVFVLICAKSHLESFNIDKVSAEIKPVELEESTKTNYIDFVGSDAYFSIGKVHLNENTIIDLDATLEKIKDKARMYGIDTITFVDTIKNVLDIYTEGKYTLEPGSFFYVNNDGPNLKHFILVTKGGDNPGKILARSIDPVEKPDEDPFTFGNESDDDSDGDEVKDYSEVNLGNFISGSFYSDQYRALAIQYGFDMNDTMKQIEKMASQYCIQMINLVDIVDSQNEITADKYTLEPGSVFFVTNKNDESRSPVFMLIYAQPYTKVRSSDISKFSFEIAPAEVEESTKTNDIEFINSDAYFNIGKVQLSPNTIIDLDATLTKIKDEARVHDIDTITFVDTIGNSLDIYTKGKYTLEPGSLFCHRGNGWLNFMLILKDKNTPDTVRFIWPVEKSEENASQDDIEFVGADAYYKIDKAYPSILAQNSLTIDLDTTLARIKERARAKNIKTITFVGIIKDRHEMYYKGKYSQAGSLYFIKNNERTRFILITGTIDYANLPLEEHIDPVVVFKKDDSDEDSSESKEDDIKFIGIDDYYKIDKAYLESDQVIDLDATLTKIKVKAKEKGVKTITFMGTIDENGNHTSDTFSYEPGALFFVKNAKWVRFELITRTDLTTFHHIYPVLAFKKDDSEDESDSVKE